MPECIRRTNVKRYKTEDTKISEVINIEEGE